MPSDNQVPAALSHLLVVAPATPLMDAFATHLRAVPDVSLCLSQTMEGLLEAAMATPPDLVFLWVDTQDAVALSRRATQLFDAGVVLLCPHDRAAAIPPDALNFPSGLLSLPADGLDIRRVLETGLYITTLRRRAVAAERARDEALARYRLFAENINDVIFTLDMDLNYTYISPSVLKQRGYGPEEVVGRSIRDMLTPASLENVLSVFAEEKRLEAEGGAADPLRSRTLDLEIVRKSGGFIWMESKFSFLRDENQRAVGLIGVNRDMTERRQMMERIRESEEKFKSLAEACPFAIMIYQNNYWVYANPAAEHISGYSREELYQLPFWRIVHPDYQPLVRERGQNRQSGQQAPPSYDFKIINKSGQEVWVSLSGTGLMYEGKPAGLITVIDINERKKAETVIRQSEEKYRTILDSIEDGYYEVDLGGNFVFFNDMLCRISRMTRDEILGLNFRDYMDKANADKMIAAFNRVFTTGKPERACDLKFVRKDGSCFYVELSISLMQDASGNPTGFRGIVRDINERVEAESHRQKLEAQLQQAQKMEAVGTLAGGIAHDFNNILQAINGYTQLLLLRKTPDHPDYRKLTQLQHAGERAARLIQQLLTFSRKMEGCRRILSLNHEVRQVEELLRQTVPKMITIEVRLDEGLWAVDADPMHIEQMLLNLGSNAADAMQGGGRLTIETANVELDQRYCSEHLGATPGKYVLLSVADTGQGMDAATVAHIFDPFFTTKAVGKGTGLGLASVYGIVKTLGGYIMCYSEPGQGTVFKIYLPGVAAVPEVIEAPRLEARLRGGSETILVVDDEPTIREAATEMLTHHGYDVLTADSGENALSLCVEKGKGIHLILMDISMPGMGGYQCLSEIKKQDPAAKVIIASGYATSGHAREAMDLGAAGFIGKPYRLTDLVTKVRAVLDGE